MLMMDISRMAVRKRTFLVMYDFPSGIFSGQFSHIKKTVGKGRIVRCGRKPVCENSNHMEASCFGMRLHVPYKFIAYLFDRKMQYPVGKNHIILFFKYEFSQITGKKGDRDLFMFCYFYSLFYSIF